MPQSSPTLDRPALWLSLLGGSIAGLISVRAALWSALAHQPMDWDGWYTGHVMGGHIGNLLIPALVALVARRRYFLWACLAAGMKLSWVLAELILTWGSLGSPSKLVDEGRGDLVDLFLFAGLISLIRYRWAQKRERTAAAQEARRQITATQHLPPQEGVWPPPPTRPTDT